MRARLHRADRNAESRGRLGDAGAAVVALQQHLAVLGDSRRSAAVTTALFTRSSAPSETGFSGRSAVTSSRW